MKASVATKTVEYDEHDEKLICGQNQEFSCITSLSSFVQNMLSKDVLDIDVSQYLEENWPLVQKMFKMGFTILGKKCTESFLRVFIQPSETNLLPPLVCTLILKLLSELTWSWTDV